VYDGYVYRTLTGLLVDGDKVYCENEWTEIPDGWESFPNNQAIVDNVVYTHKWSTNGIAFEGINGFYATLKYDSRYHNQSGFWVDIDGNKRKLGICTLAFLVRRKC